MSYIERAVYDYIINIITDGIKVLFSKRFIIFTILLLASGSVSILVISYQDTPDIDLVQTFLLLQAAISISFIVAGLFAKTLLSTMKRLILLLIVIFVISVIGIGSSTQFLDIPVISNVLLQYYPLICLFLWTFFMPLAGFGFARGMFYNKVTGSLLFLGKPENDKRALFYIFFALLSLVSMGLGIAIFFTQNNLLIQYTGIIGSFASIIIFFIVFGVIIRNDTLNSTLAIFFVSAALPTMIMLLISNGGGIVGTLNYILLVFSLIYTAQGQARRASKYAGKTEEEIRLEAAKKKHEKTRDSDPFGVSKTFNFLGAEGIVLIFLGTFLGYNLLQIEYYYDKAHPTTLNNLYFDIFNELTVGQLYQIISIIVVTLIILFIILTNFVYPPARNYYKSDLIRLPFLPNYDEVKAYFIGVQSGEISKKEMTSDAVKLVGGQLAKASYSAGKSIIGAGLGKLGFGKKTENDNEDNN
jgi:hypothetical protein